jgi:hypothetical protein
LPGGPCRGRTCNLVLISPSVRDGIRDGRASPAEGAAARSGSARTCAKTPESRIAFPLTALLARPQDEPNPLHRESAQAQRTGPHRSDFSHSLASCWPARTVQNGSTSEAGGDGFRDVRGTYGVQGVPGKSLGVHARGRQTPLGFWRVVTRHPADAGACGCGAKVRVGSGGEATKSTCRVSSLVVTNALHTQHMRCWSPSWIIHQLQSAFRPTIVAMLPC